MKQTTRMGGWYLHFDPTGETTDAVLYMSKADVNEEQANIIAAAPGLLAAAKDLLWQFLDRIPDPVDSELETVKAAEDVIARAEGRN